jgi:hypothetical protein
VGTEIDVSRFQPFQSRVGKDTVLGLRFGYDPELVAVLKSAVREAARALGVGFRGGWLPEHKLWFVENDAWPSVRRRLLEAGHTLRNEPDLAAEADAQRLREIEARVNAAGPPMPPTFLNPAETDLIARAPDDLRFLLDLVRFQALLIRDLKEEVGR